MAGGRRRRSKRELEVQSSWPFTWASHVLGITACVMVMVWCVHCRGGLAFESATNNALIFNVHPFLSIVGFIFLGSEAILAYRVLPGTMQQKKFVHLTLQLVALAFGIVGTYAVIKYHTKMGAANFHSVHSWLGAASIILYAAVWILGFVAFWYPGAPGEVRAAALPWHVVSGFFAYVITLLAAVLGFLEKLTHLEASGLDKFGGEALLVNFTGIVVVLLGASVVLSTITTPPPPLGQETGYKALAEDPKEKSLHLLLT